MALNWQRIDEADTTDASLWLLVDELHQSKPDSDDVEKVERLLKFGNLPPKVYVCIDEALNQARFRTTQRIDPIWAATVGESDRAKLRDTLPDEAAVERSESFEATDKFLPSEPFESNDPTDKHETLDAGFTSESILDEFGPAESDQSDQPTEQQEGSLGWMRLPELVRTAEIADWSVPEQPPVMSGIFARPDQGLRALMPTGIHSIRFADNTYEDVDAETLIHLFRRGVLLGAEVLADGRWIPVSEHPEFDGFNRAAQAEFDRIVGRHGSRPEEVTRPNAKLEDIEPTASSTNIFTKPPEPNESSELTEVFSAMLGRNGESSDTNILLMGDLDPDFAYVNGPDDSMTGGFDSASTSTEIPSAKAFAKDFKVQDEVLFPLPPRVGHDLAPPKPGKITKPGYAMLKKIEAEAAMSTAVEELETLDIPRQEEIETAEVPRAGFDDSEEPDETIADSNPELKVEKPTPKRRSERVPEKASGTSTLLLLGGVVLLGVGVVLLVLIGQGRLKPKIAPAPEVISVVNNDAFRIAGSALHLALAVPADSPGLQRSVADQLVKDGDYQKGIRIMTVADHADPTPSSAHRLAEWKLKARDFAGARRAAIDALHRGGESDSLRNIFAEAVRHDQSLHPTPTSFRVSEHADDVEWDKKKPFVVTLRRGDKPTGSLYINHKKARGLPRRMLAAQAYCAVVGCKFQLATSISVTLTTAELTSLMQPKVAKSLIRNALWEGSKGSQIVQALWIPVDQKSYQFPLHVTEVWRSWLDPALKDELQKRFTTYLLPWDEIDPNLRPEFAKLDTSTSELAAQVSSLLLFAEIMNSDALLESESLAFKASSTRPTKLINKAFDDVFVGRLSRGARKTIRHANRFNVREILALNLISPLMMDEVLFPAATRGEQRILTRFWKRRDRWKSRYERLLGEHDESSVLLGATSVDSAKSAELSPQ